MIIMFTYCHLSVRHTRRGYYDVFDVGIDAKIVLFSPATTGGTWLSPASEPNCSAGTELFHLKTTMTRTDQLGPLAKRDADIPDEEVSHRHDNELEHEAYRQR